MDFVTTSTVRNFERQTSSFIVDWRQSLPRNPEAEGKETKHPLVFQENRNTTSCKVTGEFEATPERVTGNAYKR
jgi:hypothetical protein